MGGLRLSKDEAAYRNRDACRCLCRPPVFVHTLTAIFTFDSPKRQANLAEFEAAFSFDRFVNLQTKPSRKGRARFKLIDTWFGEVVVIASPLGSEAVDIISIRRANRKERVAHDQA